MNQPCRGNNVQIVEKTRILLTLIALFFRVLTQPLVIYRLCQKEKTRGLSKSTLDNAVIKR